MSSAVYMRLFVEESVISGRVNRPLLKEGGEANVDEEIMSEKLESSERRRGIFKRLPLLRDLICFLKSRFVIISKIN